MACWPKRLLEVVRSRLDQRGAKLELLVDFRGWVDACRVDADEQTEGIRRCRLERRDTRTVHPLCGKTKSSSIKTSVPICLRHLLGGSAIQAAVSRKSTSPGLEGVRR